MFEKKFTEYLDEELGRIFPEKQKQYKHLFASLGLTIKNQDFIDFWSVYSDEISGRLGYLADLAMDLEDFNNSLTAISRKHDNLPEGYISFLNGELDDYLLYDIKTDKVYFVEGQHIQRFIKDGYYDEAWQSFEIFIKDFLNYQDL